MRKITAGLFISLDGVVESPEKWTGPYFDQQLGQTIGGMLATSDTLLLGRVTYQIFADSFRDAPAHDPMAAAMNAIPKVVVSTTLPGADWAGSTLISENVADQIAGLKEADGGDIALNGSPTLAVWLLREGLLDVLDLMLFPVLVGTGRRLFDQGPEIALRLAGSQTFDTGVTRLTYHAGQGSP